MLNESKSGTYATSRFANKSLANANPYNERMLSSGAYPNPNPEGSESYIPRLADLDHYISFSSVERLDFVRFTQMGTGVGLILTTKSGDKRLKEKQFELKDYLPLGYQKYKEYASPLLSVDMDEYDLQTHPTLLWLPSVRFDGNSHDIDLKSPVSSDYQILIEGLTEEGEIISEVL